MSIDDELKIFFDDLRQTLNNNCEYDYRKNNWSDKNFNDMINNWNCYFNCPGISKYTLQGGCNNHGNIWKNCDEILKEKKREYNISMLPYMNYLEIKKLKKID